MPLTLESEAQMKVESQENETMLQRTPYKAPLLDDDHNGSEVLTQAEADEIFAQAVAELDTQPLKIKDEPFTIGEVLEVVFLVSVLCFSFVGIVWQCITYPHTLVVLYTKAIPASITATLDVPTRALAPVTITRSATAATTGTGHQDARAATGTLIFYNGGATPQYVPIGSVFTGNDGVKVTTDQSVTIPAANLPAIGSIPVFAHAVLVGSKGNIAAFDIDIALSPVLKVRNEAPFTNGRDARTYKAVAAKDLTTLTSTVNETVTQTFTTAFSLQPGEAAIPMHCTTKATPTHQAGEEAQTVTPSIAKTCLAIAYNQSQLTHAATAAFTNTRPGRNYHIVGSVQTTLRSVSPFSVTLSGKWAFTFSQGYQDSLAQHIQGDDPAKARAYLLRTGVISYASVPNTLASADYINFLVLVG